MPDLRLVLGAALVGGTAWLLMTYPVQVGLVLGLAGIACGAALLRVRPAPRAKARPVVEAPSMEDGIPLAALRNKEVWAPHITGDKCHWVIGGLSGYGKSNAINALLVQLCQMPDVQIVGIDPKRGLEFGPWRRRMAAVATRPREWHALLLAVEAEMERRLERIGGFGARKIDPARMGIPWLVLVIDETSRVLLDDDDPDRIRDCTRVLRELIQMGRAAGISVVMATQRPDAKCIPTSIRDVAVGKIAFRCTTPEMVVMILGERVDGCRTLRRGVAMVWDDHTETFQRVRFQLVPDETVEAWVDRTARYAVPWVVPPLPRTPTPNRSAARRGRRSPTRSTR
jgi:hypothetical protein